MENYSELIPIPYKMEMNNNLSSAKESTMLKVLGKPGALTTDCGEVNSEFAPRLKYGVNIGPFKASGLQQAVESLIQIFAQIKIDNVELYNQVRQDGMLCVRSRRNNASRYSNP